MRCPNCKCGTKVIDSREIENGMATNRRRECTVCGLRFSTKEYIQGNSRKTFKKQKEKQMNAKNVTAAENITIKTKNIKDAIRKKEESPK